MEIGVNCNIEEAGTEVEDERNSRRFFIYPIPLLDGSLQLASGILAETYGANIIHQLFEFSVVVPSIFAMGVFRSCYKS